ncbi:hypothetical protein D3C74_442870 [compost metagenome]
MGFVGIICWIYAGFMRDIESVRPYHTCGRSFQYVQILRPTVPRHLSDVLMLMYAKRLPYHDPDAVHVLFA